MESTARRTAQPFRINTYLEPDVLTSFEYSTTFQRRDHLLPEMRLMFAVLTNAIESLQKYAGAKSRRCRKIFQEAEAWIFGGNGQNSLFLRACLRGVTTRSELFAQRIDALARRHGKHQRQWSAKAHPRAASISTQAA